MSNCDIKVTYCANYNGCIAKAISRDAQQYFSDEMLDEIENCVVELMNDDVWTSCVDGEFIGDEDDAIEAIAVELKSLPYLSNAVVSIAFDWTST